MSKGHSRTKLGELPQRVLAAAGLVAAAPVLVAAAVAIAWQDGFPIFFSQNRVGRSGKPFRLWKLRSMRSGQKGTAVTAGGDSRITPIGRVLRRYKLDELPQLWNVVRGDMLLIGARPEVPDFVDPNDAVWQEVLLEKPGITDYSTLMYRREEELLAAAADPLDYYRKVVLPDKLSLHLAYRRNRNLLADLKLLMATVVPAVSVAELPVQDQTHV